MSPPETAETAAHLTANPWGQEAAQAGQSGAFAEQLLSHPVAGSCDSDNPPIASVLLSVAITLFSQQKLQ